MSVHISGVSGFKTPEERELAGSEAGVGDKCSYEMKHGYVQKQQERGSERERRNDKEGQAVVRYHRLVVVVLA